MKTLAVTSGAVVGVWAVIYKVPQPIPPKTAWYDTTIVYEIAIVFSLAALVMLISRRLWTLRGIGLFFSILAVGVLFSNAVYVRHMGYVMRNNRIVPNTDPGVQEGISDFARALLLIGGPLLLLGLLLYLYGRFGPRSGRLLWLWKRLEWLVPEHDDDLGTVIDRRHTVRREEDRLMRAELADPKQRMEGTTT